MDEEEGADMEARKARVKKVCAKYDSTDRWREAEQGKNFWFDIEHGLAFCSHAKVVYFLQIN